MSRLFVVKKPCVIECKYYEAGGIYQPSGHMACTALKKLIDHEFLEEKLILQGKNEEALNYVNGLIAHTTYVQNHLNYLRGYLHKVEKILKEM